MSAVTDLHAAAAELLQACVDALDAHSIDGAPDLRYVSHGPPALDCCPMLTVHVGNVGYAQTGPDATPLGPGHRIATTGVVEQVTLTVTVVRCTGKPAAGEAQPYSAAEQNAIAERTNSDLWAIRNWLITEKRNGGLYPPDWREFAMGNAVARTVEGLCAGWLLPVSVQLDGFTT